MATEPKETKTQARNTYDESKIQTLSALEHIRLRPGMYIGRLGDGRHVDDGIYVLLKEIVDNSIDEFIMGNGTRIMVNLEGRKITVRDLGRGIPLGKIVECVSIINTGAKYNDEVFQFSVGLNGVGTKAVNALSSHFVVRAFRDGKVAEAVFEKGLLVSEKKGTADEPDGTYIEFIPDEELFGDYTFNPEYIIERMWNYAYLNTGLTLEFNKKNYRSAHGLLDLLEKEVGDDDMYKIIHYRGKQIEFAFTHTPGSYGETYFSYVNGQHTSDGGLQGRSAEGCQRPLQEKLVRPGCP